MRKRSILSDVLAAETEARRAVASEHAARDVRDHGKWICDCAPCRLVRAEGDSENADDVADGHGGKRKGAGRPADVDGVSQDSFRMGSIRLPDAIAERYFVEALKRGIAITALAREILIKNAPPPPKKKP